MKETYDEWKERNDKASREYWERKRKESIKKGVDPDEILVGDSREKRESTKVIKVKCCESEETDWYGEFPLAF